MRPELDRRTLLATGVAALAAAVAGCSDSDDDSTPDPDEGRDSYGVHLVNETDEATAVEIKVTYTWEDETPFEETVEVDPGGSRTWNGVITEEVEHSVVAKIGNGETRHETGTTFVTPGDENAPEDANVQVRVVTLETNSGPITAVSVYFASRREGE